MHGRFRGKVLGEKWVILGPDNQIEPDALSPHEGGAWNGLVPLGEWRILLEQRGAIEEHKSKGYRAVKVQILEVEE